MPLFGSKNKHNDNTALNDTTGGGRHHQANHGFNDYPSGGAGPNAMGPTHMGAGQPGFTGANDFVPAQHQQAPGHTGGFTTGNHYDQDPAAFGAGGLGPTHAAGARGAGIPATGAVNHGSNATGGAGQRLTGKVESAIGSMVGSNALKAKGLQKEQEANSIKLQGRELAEAERLEREALMRRECAVGHGAHPANSSLGAGHVGTGGGVGGHAGGGTQF
ncbi:hypothetical protein JR316_0009059 [Psilocybe cubensis]|uniref:Uncharacterized protein n=2 Tax=Psilocybe cubensis TaxID=181762 RepID=A0A8H7XYF3_PSICU|nr:hypothetical protein JR316_0009059 [Psilocybe cubensis]KAH9478602.1 hypothetical protein JR316_0009059 [Psilocybe cubensis]